MMLKSFILHILKVLSVLLCSFPCCKGWTQSPTPSHSSVVCRASSTDIPNEDRQRKKKNNKYAKFSKADKLEKDPLEAMIAESEVKVLELEIKTKKKRNVPLPNTNNEPRIRNEISFPDTKTIDPYDPTTYGYTELGTIVGAHGVKGMLKVTAVTEFSERLCRPGVRHIKAPNRRSPRKINLVEGKYCLDDEYLIKLEGIGDRDAANKLRGSVLYAREEERPETLEQDEYLVSELVGLEVFLEEGYNDEVNGSKQDSLGGKFVGTVCGVVLAEEMCVVPGLGQDMLEIVLPRGPGSTASWKDEMVLIPLVPEIVPRVDINGGAIHITPPLGLLDLTYVREEKVRIKGFLPPAKG
jgi:ribosomal 30S subunit maturation factor RimM